MSVLTIARLELFRLFGTKRGWVAAIALLLVWGFVMRFVLFPASNMITSSNTASVVLGFLQILGWEYLTQWPTAEVSMYWIICLHILPFFCVVIAADQIASDKFRGTLRYITLRTSRTTVFFGRFLGQALIQLLLVAVTLATVIAIVAWTSPDRLNLALSSAPILLSNLFIVLLPYIALMSLVSVLAKSTMQAILFAVIAWIAVLIVMSIVESQVGDITIFEWLLPGSQVTALKKLTGWQTLQLAYVPVLQTAVLLGMGWVAMHRSDL